MAQRWLHSLDPETANSLLGADRVAARPQRPPRETDALFGARLLDNMYDAVVFIDAALRITQWNRGAERLTGIAAAERLRHAPGRPTC